jgi:hypothetical protein
MLEIPGKSLYFTIRFTIPFDNHQFLKIRTMITFGIYCLIRHFFPETRKKEHHLLQGYRLICF